MLPLVLEKYSTQLPSLVSGMILLLGNAKEEGPLAQHLLAEGLGDRIVLLYLETLGREEQEEDEDEHLHMLGSLLKAYHRHFTASNFPAFIRDGRCLLLEVCCRFFNCP